MIVTSRVVPTFVHEAAGGESAADLQGAEPEGGGGAEERREDRQDVDGASERALAALAAEQRDERRADQLRAAPAEGAVGDGEPHDRVDRPRVQRPVEERGGHRGVEGLGGVRRDGARRWRGEVRQRLGDAVEHEPDAHPGAEHHRDPGDGAELRRLVVAAERDPPVAAHRQPQREDDEPARREHERPAACGDDAAEHRRGDGAERVGPRHTPDDERQDERGGDPEDPAVEHRVMVFGGGSRVRRGRLGDGIGRNVGLALLQRHGRRPSTAGPCPPPVAAYVVCSTVRRRSRRGQQALTDGTRPLRDLRAPRRGCVPSSAR